MLAGCPPVVRVFVCSSIAAVVSANCLSWQKFQHLPSSLLMPKKCLRASLPHLRGTKAPQPNTAPTDLQQVPEKLHILSDKCVGLSLPPLPPDCPTGFKIFKVDDKTLVIFIIVGSPGSPTRFQVRGEPIGTDWAIWIWQVFAPSISTSIGLLWGTFWETCTCVSSASFIFKVTGVFFGFCNIILYQR